jgi:segregation and condensation protein B
MSNEHAKAEKSPDESQIANDESVPESPSTELIAEQVDDESGTALVANEQEPAPPSENVIDVVQAKRALEAVLLAASEPMPVNEIKKIFDGEVSADTVRNLLEELRGEWADRSVELAVVASGYRFRVKPEFQSYLDKLSNDKPPRYSRAVLETLAIIAYRQPVTRGDIEDIRGVAVSPHILKTLEDRGWIDEIGHKDAPGRPALFATTKHFLDDLNLRTLDELPPLHELQATLDMSQSGSALNASTGTLALPGVDASADASVVNENSNENAHENANENISVDDETLPQTTAEANEVPTESNAMHELVDGVAEPENAGADEHADKQKPEPSRG